MLSPSLVISVLLGSTALASPVETYAQAKKTTTTTYSHSTPIITTTTVSTKSTTSTVTTPTQLPKNNNPSNWPTITQPGSTYSATKTSPADPYLTSISQALDNTKNTKFTAQYTGDFTYYAQSLTSCGDVYDDSTLTAAISHILYDSWPGAMLSNTNRNPVCGPWTTGRNILTQSGTWETVIPDTTGLIDLGGDGLPNCHAGAQCHIPLTATITNSANGKSVVVQVVDRCEGCAMGDIDVTPTAFRMIADQDDGRVHGIRWYFNAN